MRSRLVEALAAVALLLPPPAPAGDAAPSSRARLDELRVGHWVQIKGTYASGTLEADEVAVLEPGDEEALVGTVESVLLERERFRLLGQLVHTSDKTEWRELRLRDLRGTRVKVEGHYRGPRKLSARLVSTRGPGRDRVVGRVDVLREHPLGLELFVMNVRVLLPRDVALESEVPLDELPLAELDHQAVLPEERVWDDDDDIPGTIRIGESLRLGALFELSGVYEDDYDLDESNARDRRDLGASASVESVWTPADSFTVLARGRFNHLRRDDQDSELLTRSDTRLSEGWLYWRDFLAPGLDLQVGRQDFDDRREWLYDQNLDAVRLIWSRPRLRAELSVSTSLSDASDRDEHSTNLIAYVSNNDERRHLAAYVVDRRDDRAPKEYPIHFGARAYGEWLPSTWSWAELSVLRGYADDVDLKSYGFDLGATWTPDALEPFSFTVGYAFGSGDDPATTGTNESFRQTGLNDNNGKFAGVTSFRYYGELVDPELSNLQVLTLGVGTRLGRHSSLDLVYHEYWQDEAFDRLRDADLDRRPDGVHRHLGRELDLVLGVRRWTKTDLEVVLGYFDPGDAFPDRDPAWLGAFQLRYRF